MIPLGDSREGGGQPGTGTVRAVLTHIQCPYVDVFYQFQNETFVWNAEKAASNASRRGVTFEQACEVFADPILLLEECYCW